MPDTVSQDLAPDLSSVLSVTGIALMTDFGNLGQNFGPQNGSENAYDQTNDKIGENGRGSLKLKRECPGVPAAEAALGKCPPSMVKFIVVSIKTTVLRLPEDLGLPALFAIINVLETHPRAHVCTPLRLRLPLSLPRFCRWLCPALAASPSPGLGSGHHLVHLQWRREVSGPRAG